MRTPIGGLRLALLALLVAVAAGISAPANAARCNDNLPLKPGSCGQKVKDLQWLLGGHKPNVFTEIKPTFKWEPNGSYGARTKSAVVAYRYRLGYPAKGQCGARTSEWATLEVTGYLFNVLTGKARRPACWIALAAKRLAAAKAALPTAKATAWSNLLAGWVGITEQPYGSNRGPCISYGCTRAGRTFTIQSSTGAYGAAWCVSTQQEAAAIVGVGHFANDTAGVYYAVDFYAARNLVFAKPKVGSLVAFITYDRHGYRVPGTGHMGFVTAVDTTRQTFTYIAGNDHNAVSRHTITWGSRPYAFIRLPGLA